jgi:hypothetical protein
LRCEFGTPVIDCKHREISDNSLIGDIKDRRGRKAVAFDLAIAQPSMPAVLTNLGALSGLSLPLPGRHHILHSASATESHHIAHI